MPATRYVVIVSSSEMVESLSAPVPLELLAFGLDATRRPRRPDAAALCDTRVVERDPFVPAMVSDILIG